MSSIPRRRIDFNADSSKKNETKAQKDSMNESSSNPAHLRSSRRTRASSKRTLDAFVTATATATTTDKKDPAFVTPLKKSRVDEEVQQQVVKKEAYVPMHIYKNIEYKRQNETKMDPITQQVFELVSQHFILPKDLETNRIYGPKSGTSFEKHAIRAYALGLLEPANPAGCLICTACASEGHVRDDCPTLV